MNQSEIGSMLFLTPGFLPTLNVTEFDEPRLLKDFTLVNAYTWEGSMGIQMRIWRSVWVVVLVWIHLI